MGPPSVLPARDDRRSEWGPYEHAAPIDRLDLTGEVRRWSGVRTAGQIVTADDSAPERRSTTPVAVSPRASSAPDSAR
jgi:hypothetical protein